MHFVIRWEGLFADYQMEQFKDGCVEIFKYSSGAIARLFILEAIAEKNSLHKSDLDSALILIAESRYRHVM